MLRVPVQTQSAQEVIVLAYFPLVLHKHAWQQGALGLFGSGRTVVVAGMPQRRAGQQAVFAQLFVPVRLYKADFLPGIVSHIAVVGILIVYIV